MALESTFTAETLAATLERHISSDATLRIRFFMRKLRSRMGVPMDDPGRRQGMPSEHGSKHAAVAKAMDYMLRRWDSFARFLEDGRICLTNNAAERALRGLALGRKSWLFAGSDRGGDRAA